MTVAFIFYFTNAENLMKLASSLSIAILTVIAVGSELINMTTVAIAAPAAGSWDQSILGEGIMTASGFLTNLNTNVWSDSNGTRVNVSKTRDERV